MSVFITVVLLVSATTAQDGGSDRFTFEFRGEPMEEVLDRLAKTMEIDLVYNPTLVQNISVFKRVQNRTKEEALVELLSEHQLDYITLSSGTIVIVQSTLDSPRFGTMAGKIVDDNTGKPLPGATVRLADASGGTSSGASGNFSINGLMSGSHDIIVSYIGYEPVTISVYIPPGEHVKEEISLSTKPVHITPLVVESHRSNLPGGRGSNFGGDNESWETASVMKSPIRSLNLMPGVQFGLPMSDLHLQGGERGEHRIFLDGVPVYNPYSFGRMFSSFSPYAIGDVTLHKAGYGVAHGSQMAGMVHLKNDISHNRDSRAILQADPLSVNVRGDVAIPVGDGKSIQTMAALRTNFWDLYQDPALSTMLGDWDRIDPLLANSQLEDDIDAAFYTPTFRESDVGILDMHFAASYKPDSFSRIDGSLYLAENRVQSDLLNQSTIVQGTPRYLYASDSYEWRNLAGQISWNQLVTPRLDVTMQAGYTHNQFEHKNILGTSNSFPFHRTSIAGFSDSPTELEEVRRRLPTRVDENSIEHGFLKTDISYSISPQFSMDGGLQADFISSEVRVSGQTLLPDNTQDNSILVSGYLQNNHNFGRGWQVDYGSRLTWLNYRNGFFAEPRASLQYDKNDSALGFWSVRIAGGLYRQFINEYRVSNVGASSLVPDFSIWSHAGNMKIPLATHLSGSFLVEPSDQTSFTVEGVYKWQPYSPITTYGEFAPDPLQDSSKPGAFAEMTDFTTLGAGFRYRQKLLNSRIRFLGGYDYSYTRLDLDSQFGRTLSAPWNEPHRVQARLFYHAVEEITFALKWQGIWGRTWGFRDSYYNYLQYREVSGADEFSFTTPEKDRLPTFQQVDFSMIYQPSIGKTDLEVRIELINILNRQNTLDYRLIPIIGPESTVEYRVDNRRFPGFYPTMSVKVQF